MKNIIFIIVLLLSTNASSVNKFREAFQADLPRKAVKISYLEDGSINEVIVSSWNDRVKTKTGQAYRKFEQGFSYVKKQGYIKSYDDKGKVLNVKWDKSIDGGVSQEEVLKAFDLFKNNTIVKQRFAATELEINIYGGFNFSDETACQPGNRCVHVFASTTQVPVLAHAIVRLTDARVIYPEFDVYGTNSPDVKQKEN